MALHPTTSSRWTWLSVLVFGIALTASTMPLRTLALLGLVTHAYPIASSALWLCGIAFCAIALIGIIFAADARPASPEPFLGTPDILTVGWDPEAAWIHLDERTQLRHTLVLGSSGSGKTQLLLSLLAQQVARGGGALMIDAKVDRSARHSVTEICKRYNRLYDLKVLWPIDPRRSDTWNPLLRRRIGDRMEGLEEVMARVMALWPPEQRGDAEFFRSAAQNMIRAVLGTMQRINPYVTFNDLYLALTTADLLLWLEGNVTPGTEEAGAITAFLSNYRTQQGKLNLEYLKKVTGGTSLHLSAYAWGALGRIMNHTAPTLDILTALERGQIVYVALPILAQTEEAVAMARMLVADLKQAVGTIQQRREKPDPPFLVLMDEASSYMNIQGIERLFEQARTANVALVAASQVVSGFAQTSRTQLDFILGNTTTKIIMTLGDFTTAETMADNIGQDLAWFAGHSRAQQKGTSSAWVSPLPNRASRGRTAGETAMQRYDYLVRPEDLIAQPTGRAVIFKKDPATGAHLYRNVHTCLTTLDDRDAPDPPEIPHQSGPTGLNLFRLLQQGEATVPAPEPVPTPTTPRAATINGRTRSRGRRSGRTAKPSNGETANPPSDNGHDQKS